MNTRTALAIAWIVAALSCRPSARNEPGWTVAVETKPKVLERLPLVAFGEVAHATRVLERGRLFRVADSSAETARVCRGAPVYAPDGAHFGAVGRIWPTADGGLLIGVIPVADLRADLDLLTAMVELHVDGQDEQPRGGTISVGRQVGVSHMWSAGLPMGYAATVALRRGNCLLLLRDGRVPYYAGPLKLSGTCDLMFLEAPLIFGQRTAREHELQRGTGPIIGRVRFVGNRLALAELDVVPRTATLRRVGSAEAGSVMFELKCVLAPEPVLSNAVRVFVGQACPEFSEYKSGVFRAHVRASWAPGENEHLCEGGPSEIRALLERLVTELLLMVSAEDASPGLYVRVEKVR